MLAGSRCWATSAKASNSTFDPAKKYPLLVLVHGGPQGAWPDGWSFRWNAQVFASAGYVVFQPNPRGSTGWGQSFTDDINGDWGGKAFEDVMKGTDFALLLPGVDKARVAAAGASYGGYLINWIAGHTDRFKALVTHDGVFDQVSMYGSTEELWFPEWELGGPYWSHAEGYARQNPRDFVKNFKTPTLVVHGERDYRVPALGRAVRGAERGPGSRGARRLPAAAVLVRRVAHARDREDAGAARRREPREPGAADAGARRGGPGHPRPRQRRGAVVVRGRLGAAGAARRPAPGPAWAWPKRSRSSRPACGRACSARPRRASRSC